MNDTMYKATVKVKAGITRDYTLDFQVIGKDNLKDVVGKDAVSTILKEYNYDYDEPIPCNLRDKFEFVVDGVVWNTYKYPVWEPEKVESESEFLEKCKYTASMFKHVYGEQMDLAMDYLTVEFMNPIQPLPIQILYSSENETGKTTILNHRNWIYGKNSVIIDSATFDDKFNGLVVGKNVVGIDEGKLKDAAAMEKIKMRVTAKTIPFRAMRKTAVEIVNFGKYFLTTNRADFAKIEDEDRRFWVIHVPSITKENFDANFEDKIKSEIPYLIGFIKYRWENRFKTDLPNDLSKMKTPKKVNRLWFHKDQYTTKILEKIVIDSRTFAAKTFLDTIIEWFDKLNSIAQHSTDADKVWEIHANVMQLKNNLFSKDYDIKTTTLRNVLERELGIKVVMNDSGIATKNQNYKNYIEVFNGEVEGHVSEIYRRNVYCLKYAELVKLRDGNDYNKYGEITGVTQTETKM